MFGSTAPGNTHDRVGNTSNAPVGHGLEFNQGPRRHVYSGLTILI